MNNEVKRTIMAIGAHADDIEINLGATLLKYHDMGYEIIYVMTTNNMSGITSELQEDGSVTRMRESPVPMMKRRKRECDDAAKVLSAIPIHLDHPQRHYNTGNGNDTLELRYGCELPEGVAADVPSILTACDDADSIEKLANLILQNDPECVITHGVSNTNIEHSASSILVTNAFWKAAEQGYEGGMLQWNEGHTLNGDFNCRWETFVDGTGFLDRKMELIGLHRCQMPTAHRPEHGHRQLSIWRGKACGCENAEVFNWVRRPVRCSSKMTGVHSPIWGDITTELIQHSR
jgi:LmbE family N-acetylglucosaminyl deacetylase